MSNLQPHRTRWKLPEIKTVTDAAAELLITKYKAMDMFPSADAVQKSDILDAVKQGQLALAVDRRKKVFGQLIWKTIEQFVRDGLRAKIAEEQRRKSDAGKPERAEAYVKIIEQPTLTAPEPTPQQPAPQQTPPIDNPIIRLGEVLGAALARGFVSEVEQSPMMADLIKLLTARIAPPTAEEPAKAVVRPAPRLASTTVSITERNRKPKVAIIGLMADQRQSIQMKFPNIDMRFLDNRPSGDRLATVTSNCDAALLMTKFCSHLPMNKFKAKHYVPVNGGMTDLATVLRGRYGEPTSARHPAAA